MGCVFGCLASIISHVLHVSERILFCFSCAALVSCIVLTLIVTLCLGIGLGYNYCFIDFRTKHRHVAAKYHWYRYKPTPHWRRSEGHEEYDYDPDYEGKVSQTTTENIASTTSTETYEPVRINSSIDEESDTSTLIEKYDTVESTSYHVASTDSDQLNSTRIENNVTEDMNFSNSTKNSTVAAIILKEIMKENATASPYNLSNTIEVNDNRSKVLIPISGLDLISLLSKWRAENRNYSLQIVVT